MTQPFNRAPLPDEDSPRKFSVQEALARICLGGASRLSVVASNIQYAILSAIYLVPGASADYPNLNSPGPNYDDFVASPSNDTMVQADVNNFITNGLDFQNLRDRAYQIRLSGDRAYCTGNLSVALKELGAVYAASSSGATSLLTLIPTAGVLIGAPTQELWILFKLMPIAGVLSMMLSIGGSIIPTEVNAYERNSTLFFSRRIESAMAEIADTDKKTAEDGKTPALEITAVDGKTPGPKRVVTMANRFATKVHGRVTDHKFSRKTVVIWTGIALQCLWLSFILVACWILESGSVIAWWCNNEGWMYMWYSIVILSTVLENFAGVPFSKQWTIRISRAPKVEISDDFPQIIRSDDPRDNRCLLERLKGGYSITGRIGIRESSWSASKDAIYVILSVNEVSIPHSFLRVFSKLLSVIVFAASTVLFASSTLVTILLAIVSTVLILLAGIFGRVTAMWMANEIMQNKHLFHIVVDSHQEASDYLEKILEKPGLMCEVLGLVIVDGRCVKRLKKLRWSSFLGVLASPFDLIKLATPETV